ncbi:MAG TPA: 3-dehydroquinate synthase [Desulfobulbaceae bacterium]|nr:MAG: 3-dehydroquinate synthase [Deltaproteobacteria bacterium RIFOXYD12_FULL_53_23]HCC54795.1 3-dehydroquinate synthase [Desulfobulbaceae bacterium]
MRTIRVGLGDRAYDILIENGMFMAIGADLKQRAIAKRYVVVADSHVAELFGDRLMASLAEAGVSAEIITFPRGEASKHLVTVAELASKLAQMGLDRKDGLIALGGGVAGDITGFLAAIYMRGIPFVQIPTTLLAQVDSSVGGKTGVDIPEGKNLVGAFYQPRCVYIDSSVLMSLSYAELLNGLAEVIKYGVIYDAEFFRYLADQRQAILAMDLVVLEQVIARCCAIKAAVVAVDEREADLRRILNFGHTIGHAVEATSNYNLAHGAAVGLGMVAACRLAVAKGIFPKVQAEEVCHLIADYGLPTEIPAEFSSPQIRAFLKTDKKTVEGRPFFVLPTEIGKVVITDEVSETLIDEILASRHD